MQIFKSGCKGDIVCMETIIIQGQRLQIVFDDGFFIYRKPRDTNAHCHLNHELYFSENGKCIIWCNGENYSFNKNSLFLIPAGLEHNIQSMSENASIYSLRFSFSPLDETDGSMLNHEFQKKLQKPLKFVHEKNMIDLLQQVRWELSQLMPLSTEKIQGILQVVFAELLRRLLNPEPALLPLKQFSVRFDFTDTTKLPGYCKDVPREFYMDILDDFFTHRPVEKATLKALAEYLHLSISQTQRVIKSYYGISFQQKLIKTKIEQSKRLMVTTNLTLEEISKTVGYTSYNAFFEAFCLQTGETPSNYRHSINSF